MDKLKWISRFNKVVLCKHCGKEFTRKAPGMKFCSSLCRIRERIPLKEKEVLKCKLCGKDFIRHGGQKFCSKRCWDKNRFPSKDYPIRKCRVCEKEFKPAMKWQFNCSKECVKKYKGNNRHDRERRIFIAKIGNCENCGLNNKLALIMHHIKGRENKEEVMVLCANCHTIYHRIAGKGFVSENCSKEEVIKILKE